MPNPHGRTAAPMQEPTKDELRDYIDRLRRALFITECRRLEAEQRLADAKAVLNGDPISEPFGLEYPWQLADRTFEKTIRRVLKEAESDKDDVSAQRLNAAKAALSQTTALFDHASGAT